MVEHLIDQETREWDRQMVYTIFFPFEAEQIRRIPLARRVSEDVMFWPWEKNQQFSVRFAYHLIQKKKAEFVLGPSDDHNYWKWIWRLNIPPKIKLFVWRLCHNRLATKTGLLARGIKTDPICFLCGEKEKSIPHLFTSCQWTRRVWFLSPLGKGPHLQPTESMGDWLRKSAKKESSWVMELLSVTLWSIWVSRNNLIFAGGQTDPMSTCRRANLMLEDYQMVNQAETRNPPSMQKWSPPPAGLCKINSDAAYLGNSIWGLGVVCREDIGGLRYAATKQVVTIDDPAVAECFALRWAMELADIWGLRKVVLESDCRRAVEELKNPDTLSPLFGLLRDAVDLASSMEVFSFVFSPRACNMVAHCLAKSYCYSEGQLWSKNFPRDIVSLAWKDVILT